MLVPDLHFADHCFLLRFTELQIEPAVACFIRRDQKIAVSPALDCRKPTTNLQPKPDAELKTVVSAKSYGG
jgi:hypothetical protein